MESSETGVLELMSVNGRVDLTIKIAEQISRSVQQRVTVWSVRRRLLYLFVESSQFIHRSVQTHLTQVRERGNKGGMALL